MNDDLEWKGLVSFCFLCVRPIKNQLVWDSFLRGWEDYFTIYAHISGKDFDKGEEYFGPTLWQNRVETHGINHVATAWGEVSLVKAEGIMYEAALKNKQNKYFCVLSESDIPLWSFPEFYKMLKTSNKSYITMDSGRGDEDIFSPCFPEKFIPSTNRARTRKQRDARKLILRTSHQWKILVRREAKEFVKMCKSKEYLDAYDKCFIKDPERLAPDEYSFANWLVLKHGREYLKKHIINVETTFVDFDKKAIHAKEFKHITNGMKKLMCEDKKHGYPFFARKFPPDAPKLIKELPLRCVRRSKSKSRKSPKSRKSRKSHKRKLRKSRNKTLNFGKDKPIRRMITQRRNSNASDIMDNASDIVDNASDISMLEDEDEGPQVVWGPWEVFYDGNNQQNPGFFYTAPLNNHNQYAHDFSDNLDKLVDYLNLIHDESTWASVMENPVEHAAYQALVLHYIQNTGGAEELAEEMANW